MIENSAESAASLPFTRAEMAAVTAPRTADAKAAAQERETHRPEDEPENTKKHFVSSGKRIHNELTYRGVDFLLNSAVGVATTYWTTRTHSGQKYFSQAANNFFKKALSPVLHSEAALNQGAKRGTQFVSIIVGGTAIIPGMIFLENKKNKKAIIRWCDEHVHGEEKVKNDPRFAASYAAIDDEPKKNFTTGMAARIAVLTPMIMMTTNPSVDKYAVRYLYNPISKASRFITDGIGLKPKTLMQRGVEEIADGDISIAPKFVSDWDFIHKTIGFDLGLTFIYSFAHEATYKSLAALGFKKTAAEVEADTARPGLLPDSEPASYLLTHPQPLQAAEPHYPDTRAHLHTVQPNHTPPQREKGMA